MRTHGVLLLFVIAAPAFATDRFYPDSGGLSPSGQYEALSISPQNAGGWRPFAENFTITMRHRPTGIVCWTWKQRDGEASPVWLQPTDDGFVIMQDAWCCFHVFDRRGVPRQVFSALQLIPESEKRSFCQDTTAGLFWQQFQMKGWHVEGGTVYWYLRTYWGRLFIVDFAAQTHATDEALERRVEQRIVDDTKAWLARFDGVFLGPCSSCQHQTIRPDIAQRVFVVKQYGLSPGGALEKQVIASADDFHHPDIKDELARMPEPLAIKFARTEFQVTALLVAVVIVLASALVASRILRRLRKR